MLRVNHPSQLEIHWESLEGMVKGISAIDMNHMVVRDEAEAEQFICNYGYDFQQAEDRAELVRLQEEAISFIERRFLNDAALWHELGEESWDLRVPDIFKTNQDVRKLLLTASGPASETQRWACAILKVMHILCHINNAIFYRYYAEAKNQILSRYNSILTHQDNGEILLGHPDLLHLTIAGFEIKDEKSRDSILLKLLCKRENVAEEVFDMIGVRIITHTPIAAVLALEVLHRNKVVIFPNIIPSRSRNSLVDFDAFKEAYQAILNAQPNADLDLVETLSNLHAISASENGTPFNPNNTATLGSYHSVHITERQLVRFKMPGCLDETRFFFPYELQIVDETNYLQNMAGSSAHTLYKQNQLIQARRRVLGPLFLLLKKQKHRESKPLEREPST